MIANIILVAFLSLYVIVPVLIIWIIIATIKNLFTAGDALITLNQRKKTNLHYYDHQDRYFDYEQSQWRMK